MATQDLVDQATSELKLKPVQITVLTGSAASIKVLAALAYKDIDYSTKVVTTEYLKQHTPSPHVVPIMQQGRTMVSHSTEILRLVDRKISRQSTFYPEGRDDIEHWSRWAEEDILVDLFNYSMSLDDDWSRSGLPLIRAISPTPLQIRFPLTALRRVQPILPCDRDNKDAPRKSQRYAEQSSEHPLYLKLNRLGQAYYSSATQWLCGTNEPSGADFAVFDILQVLLDRSGDCDVEPIMPTLLEDSGATRLRESFDAMSQLFNIRYYT